jgi:hypothetical protein
MSYITLHINLSTGLYKHRKGPPLCTKEHKEAQRTIRAILISTKTYILNFKYKNNKIHGKNVKISFNNAFNKS